MLHPRDPCNPELNNVPKAHAATKNRGIKKNICTHLCAMRQVVLHLAWDFVLRAPLLRA